jgi:hypothetical protein
MTELLQRAIAEVSKLSDEQQDAIASRLLAELEVSLPGKGNHREVPHNSTKQPQCPAFGFMSATGSINGDIVSPVVPDSDWDVLQ